MISSIEFKEKGISDKGQQFNLTFHICQTRDYPYRLKNPELSLTNLNF